MGEAAFHGVARLTAQVLETLGQQVVGLNPLNTDALWQDFICSGYRIGSTGAYMSAISALDIACFDIKGKALGTPIWNLLGGTWDRVPVYSSLMERHLSPQRDVEKVLARMEQGYSWVKLHTATAWSFDQGKDGTIETVKALRDHCGDYNQLKILADVNQAYMVPGAMRVGKAQENLKSHILKNRLYLGIWMIQSTPSCTRCSNRGR